MAAVGDGRLQPLPVSRGDEIGALVARFNRMAEELEEKRRLARELAASEKVIVLGRLTAGVAHEVNNPLAGMLNCLSTLRAHGGDPALADRYLPLIEKGLRRIEALVHDLLIEQRTEDAQGSAEASSLDDVRERVAAEIDPAKITLDLRNELPPGLRVNPLRIEQIILNLIRNAAQATPAGGRIDCRFRADAGQLIFEVADTGHGITAEDRAHIFDPFFTRRPNGTGLGLWIVYRLVQSMRGRIEVESEPGRGALFRILLPRVAPHVAEPA